MLQEFTCIENFRQVISDSPDLRQYLSDNRLDRSQKVYWELSTVILSRQEYLWDQKTDKVQIPSGRWAAVRA